MASAEPPTAGSEQPAFIDLVDHTGASKRIALEDSPTVIGRIAECAIRLDHPMVSRKHAQFELKQGQWHVTDLKSHNGTRLNKTAVHSQALSNGDCIEIGPFSLTYQQRFTHVPGIKPTPPHQTVLALNDQAVAIRTLHEMQPPHIAVEHLNGLDGFTRMLMETKQAPQRLEALCRLMVQSNFGGRWAVAVTVESATSAPLVLSPVQYPDGQPRATSPYLSRSLIAAAYRRREPMLASNAQHGAGVGGFELSISPDVMMITAIAIPLPTVPSAHTPVDPARADILYAVFPPEYGTGEWLALSTLAVNNYRQAETIWANIEKNTKLMTLEADLERARRVQDRLVPRTPKMPGLGIAVRFKPCHAVGGDYVDVLPLPDGRALLVVADVCGKGLPAAMVAMGIHTIVHAAARKWAGLDDLASTASAHLVETLPMDSFVTFLAITIDPTTGKLEVANGGHPPAMIVDRAGSVRDFGECTTGPLGYAPEPPTVEFGEIAPGETMLLYTDGCFEIDDEQGEMLGLTGFRTRAALHLVKSDSPIDIAANHLMVDLDKLQGDGLPSDDRTMLLVRRETPPHPA